MTCVNNDLAAPTVADATVFPLDTTVGTDVQGNITAVFSEALMPLQYGECQHRYGHQPQRSRSAALVTVTGGNTVVFNPAQ